MLMLNIDTVTILYGSVIINLFLIFAIIWLIIQNNKLLEHDNTTLLELHARHNKLSAEYDDLVIIANKTIALNDELTQLLKEQIDI